MSGNLIHRLHPGGFRFVPVPGDGGGRRQQESRGGLLQASGGDRLQGIPGGEHLALFRNFHPAQHGFRRLSLDAPVQRTPGATQCPASSVEIFYVDPVFPGQPAEGTLSPIQFPVGRQHPPVLIAVGIPQHDFLIGLAPPQGRHIGRMVEIRLHDLPGPVQIVDGLQEGNHVKAGRHLITRPAEQPDLLGEQHHLQEVTGPLGHADQVISDRLIPKGVLRPGDHPKQIQTLLRLRRKTHVGRGEGTGIRQQIRQQLHLLFLG